VADWDDVRRIVAALPETREDRHKSGQMSWRVKDKSLAWERPLRNSDLKALGDAAPDGDILGVRVPDLGAKEAILADNSGAIFTIPHFDGYPAVLIRLDDIAPDLLAEIVSDAWLVKAPKRLAKEWLAARGLDP
jgi:hypothetical protein